MNLSHRAILITSSVLIPIFGRLIREGWIGIDELKGVEEDKIAKIKMMAGLE